MSAVSGAANARVSVALYRALLTKSARISQAIGSDGARNGFVTDTVCRKVGITPPVDEQGRCPMPASALSHYFRLDSVPGWPDSRRLDTAFAALHHASLAAECLQSPFGVLLLNDASAQQHPRGVSAAEAVAAAEEEAADLDGAHRLVPPPPSPAAGALLMEQGACALAALADNSGVEEGVLESQLNALAAEAVEALQWLDRQVEVGARGELETVFTQQEQGGKERDPQQQMITEDEWEEERDPQQQHRGITGDEGGGERDPRQPPPPPPPQQPPPQQQQQQQQQQQLLLPANAQRLRALLTVFTAPRNSMGGRHGMGFRGPRDSEVFADPRHSLLDSVLERRCGLPLTLGIVLAGVARRVAPELGLHGVNMPGRFLLRLDTAEAPWFCDVVEGRLLSQADCRARLRESFSGAPPPALLQRCLAPVAPALVWQRSLRNLILAYSHDEEAEWHDETKAGACNDALLQIEWLQQLCSSDGKPQHAHEHEAAAFSDGKKADRVAGKDTE
jgi:hypothetical protein